MNSAAVAGECSQKGAKEMPVCRLPIDRHAEVPEENARSIESDQKLDLKLNKRILECS